MRAINSHADCGRRLTGTAEEFVYVRHSSLTRIGVEPQMSG